MYDVIEYGAVRVMCTLEIRTLMASETGQPLNACNSTCDVYSVVVVQLVMRVVV